MTRTTHIIRCLLALEISVAGLLSMISNLATPGESLIAMALGAILLYADEFGRSE